MKIIFIRPDSLAVSCPPPLVFGYLSNAVKVARGDETFVVDGRRWRLSEDAIIKIVADYEPDVIGVTALSIEAPNAIRIISICKKRWPDIPVILGGPHTTACGPSLFDSVEADYLVFGEGEDTLVELLDSIEGKGNLAQVKGIAWKDGDTVVSNEARPFIEDMDRLGVDWETISPQKYFGSLNRNGFHTFSKSGKRVPIFTSRGCPMGCSYCHNIFGRKFRAFDTGRTITEMINLRDQYGVKEFEIHDDFFNLDLERAKAFMQEVIERKLNCHLAFPNGFRADRMEEELLDLLVKAGTYQTTYAIESASDRIQKLVHKNLKLERAREVVNMTAARRIVTGAYYILGFPDETEEEMNKTVDYAVSLKNHVSHFFHLMPFPGTELAESDPELSKRVREMDFGAYFNIVFNLSAVPDNVLAKIRQNAYWRFYFSLPRVARIFRDVPKNPRLIRSLAIARLSMKQSSSD